MLMLFIELATLDIQFSCFDFLNCLLLSQFADVEDRMLNECLFHIEVIVELVGVLYMHIPPIGLLFQLLVLRFLLHANLIVLRHHHSRQVLELALFHF